MLLSMSVHNFALIDALDLSFNNGMTVLLGETGAGKSILVDALNAALGARVSPSLVRSGAKKAIVEATFSGRQTGRCLAILEAHDLVWENPELVLRREIPASGPSRCFVNDAPAQSSVVREIAALLLDFHGQHDTHGLIERSRHRQQLDEFADAAVLLTEMRSAWQAFRTCEEMLKSEIDQSSRAEDQQYRCRRIVDEITAIDPKIGEDEDLRSAITIAESQEHIVTHSERARNALYSGSTSAYELLREAASSLQELGNLFPELHASAVEILSASVACEEAAQDIARNVNREEFSPELLEAMRVRLVALQNVAKSYGSLQGALDARDVAQTMLASVESRFDRISELESSRDIARQKALTVAKRIRKVRQSAAPKLKASIEAVLQTVGMKNATFEIELANADLIEHGIDSVTFLLAANSGTPVRPLGEVASGGELSRVMLALKSILADSDAVGTLVFDEIDTGISGRVAQSVGSLMKTIARKNQLICITHLPQIASAADHFLAVSKHDDGKRSFIDAHTLTHDEATTEIAKLVSGENVTRTAVASIQELMDSAKLKKE